MRVRRLLGAVLIAGAFCAAETRAEPPPVEAYAANSALDRVRLSPDGRLVSMTTPGAQGRDLVVREGDRVVYSGPLAAAPLRGVEWIGPDRLLVIAERSTDAPELGMPYQGVSVGVVIDVAQARTRVLLEATPGVLPALNNVPVRVTRNGRPAAVAKLLDPFNSVFVLAAVDLQSGIGEVIDRGEFFSQDWVTDAEGRPIARSFYDPGARRWRLESRRGEAWATVAEQITDDPPRLAGLGPTPGRVLALGPLNGVRTAFEIDPATGGFGPSLAPTNRAVDRIIPAATTLQAAGLRLAGGTLEHVFFDPMLQARWQRLLEQFPGQWVALTALSDDHLAMVVEVEGGRRSGSTYYRVDLTSGQATSLGDTLPDVPRQAVGEIRSFDFEARDGLRLNGVLTLPPNRPARRLPLVVLLHDGPERSEELGFDRWAQLLASRGYAVLQPNFRGSTGPGRTLRAAGAGQWASGMQTDIDDAIAALDREGTIDPARVCVAGIGYGGYAAVAGVTVRQRPWRCAAAINGFFDLQAVTALQPDEVGSRAIRIAQWRRALGADAADPMRLAALSPVMQAGRGRAPVLLIHNRGDGEIPVGESERMASALRTAGRDVDLRVIDIDGHEFNDARSRLPAMQALTAFLAERLPAR